MRFRNGTSILKVMHGSVAFDFFSMRQKRHHVRVKVVRQPAVNLALRAGEFERDILEDADTPSNQAIMILPVALALVPIALFQDASNLATVLYAVATDVVSVMPIAVKGMELVIYGSRRHYAFSTEMVGMSRDDRPSVIET